MIVYIGFLFAIWIQLSRQVGFITPLTPLEALFVNTQLPSIYNFHFRLDSGFRSDNFIRIKFPNYTSVSGPTCLFDVDSPQPTNTINCIAVDNSVYLQPGIDIAQSKEIYATVFLTESIPATPGHTQLLEMSTTSTTDSASAIIYDINPGYGKFVWEPYSDTSQMFLELLSLGTTATEHLQGASNDASFHIRFSEGFHAQYSRLLIVLDFPWKFGDPEVSTDRSPLYDLAVSQGQPTDLYEEAEIANFTKINDNILEIYFNDTFPAGREFVLDVTEIINPILIGSGKIRFYSTEYTSNYVKERNEDTTLSTDQSNLAITISLASGIPFSGPVSLYRDTEQYIKISFDVDADIPEGTTITYEFPSGTTIPGTLYITTDLTPLDSKGVIFTYTTNGIELTNIGELESGTTVYIQVKVFLSKILPDFAVSITLENDGTTLKFGESTPIILKTNADSLVTYVRGSSSESGVINIDGNQMLLRLTPNSRDTTNGAKLTLYTSKSLTSGGISCTSSTGGGVIGSCTLTTSTTHTTIRLTSTSGQNALPTPGPIDITMTALTFGKVGNHETAIYEIYGRLDYDGTGSQVKDFMIFAFVRPQRGVLSNFLQYHVGDFRLNTNENYPSFIRITGSSSSLSGITLTASQKLILTVYGYISLSNLLDVTDQGTFPCSSNLEITCVYVEGNPTTITSNPLDWNRVLITLPSASLSTAFNIYLPQFFTTGLHIYEFFVGKYDTVTKTYDNLYLATQYSFTPLTDLVFLTDTAADSDLKLDLEGQYAAITVTDTIPVYFKTPGGYNANSGGNIGASTILITSWDFWSSDSSVTNPSTAGSPLSSNVEDSTVFLTYLTTTGEKLRAIIWPMAGTATTAITFLLTNVAMPYSLDTPDHILYVTDRTGSIVAYNEFINGGRESLSVNSINQLSLDCMHMVRGYMNTYCTLTFVPNADIDLETKMKFIFDDAYVTISGCTIAYNDGTSHTLSSTDFECQSNLKEVLLSFQLSSKLPAGAQYKFSFYGLDHGYQNEQFVTFTIFDADFGYTIEQGEYQYYLELDNHYIITIDKIQYDFQNLDAISNLQLDFTIPRDMFSNEILEVDVGADIQGNNKNTDRLALVLYNSDTDTKINIVGALKNQILVVDFDTNVLLEKGSYMLRMDNIRTPATHSSDEIQIKIRRSTDNVIVLSQKVGAYTPYPVLKLVSSAYISLLSYRFLCVGCQGEITLQVTPMISYIDDDTIFYLHFPSYFLPALSNDPSKIECRLNSDPIECETDSEYPFRLRLYDPPTLFSRGESFEINIYGFIVPNAERAATNEEDLFFAIDSLANGLYSEQSYLTLPDIFTASSTVGSLYLRELSLSSVYVKDSSDHELIAITSIAIPVTSILTVTFVSAYSNLPYVESLTCNVEYEGEEETVTEVVEETCQVIGKTIKFTVIKEIPAGTILTLSIQAVPNPPIELTIDPNEFILGAFKTDENTIVAMGTEGLNSARNITFVQPENTLNANGGSDIYLTRGTFSTDIDIGTLDESRFQQDVVITATIEGFSFKPSVIEFYVGDISTTFKVGCNRNVKARTFPLNFTQSQDNSLSNLYGDLFNIRIHVIDAPVLITIPSQIHVVLRGYSLPYAIVLTQAPYDDVQILVDFDEAYFNGAFGVDADYSSPALNFTLDKKTQYLAFYTTEAIAAFPSTFSVSLHLDGANYNSYKLQRDTIEIVVTEQTVGFPSITGSRTDLGKTYATFELSHNVKGMAIVQVSKECGTRKSISQIKNLLRNNSFNTLEVEEDECWERYFALVMEDPGDDYTLTISGLTPETDYSLYIYFENQIKLSNAATPLIFTFTTKELNPIVKMKATFNRRIYIDQLNDLICFLLRLFETRIINVVDAQGFSCSNFIEPTNRFLDYSGNTYSNFSTEFTFYLLPDPQIENDASSSSIPTYFDSSTLKAKAIFYTKALEKGIDFIDTMSKEYTFTQKEALASEGNVKMPDLENLKYGYELVEGNATIILNEIKMETPGSIYAIAREIIKIQQDPEDEFSTIDVQTRSAKEPTVEQIYECKDWNDETVDSCGRAVISNENEVELLLKDLAPNAVYVIYYTVANEYPIDAILKEEVQTLEIRILSSANLIIQVMVMFIVILILI